MFYTCCVASSDHIIRVPHDSEFGDLYRRSSPIKFGGRGRCECEDIRYIDFHLSHDLHDPVIKGSCDILSSKSMS